MNEEMLPPQLLLRRQPERLKLTVDRFDASPGCVVSRRAPAGIRLAAFPFRMKLTRQLGTLTTAIDETFFI